MIINFGINIRSDQMANNKHILKRMLIVFLKLLLLSAAFHYMQSGGLILSFILFLLHSYLFKDFHLTDKRSLIDEWN